MADLANTVRRFENGRLVSIRDEKGNTTTMSYDAGNRLSQVTDPSGRKLTYSYDALSGKLASITDPASRQISFGYDGSGKLTSVTDAKGGVTGFGYDASGKLAVFTDANGRKTSFFYFGNSKVSRITDARTTPSKEYATNFSYDSISLVTNVTDPANHNTAFSHNSNMNLISLNNGVSSVTYTWNSNRMTDITDANGSTGAVYDSNGNITKLTDTINSTTNAETNINYDGKNNPTKVTDANTNEVKNSFDGVSNLVSSANTLRKEADANTYDIYGNVTSKTEVGAPTYNLLENGNFEWLDTAGKPEFWGYGGNTSIVSIDNTTAFFGNQSLKMSSASRTSALAYQYFSVNPGQKLTLSVPFRMQNVSGGGVIVGLEFYDAAWNFVGSKYADAWTGNGDSRQILTQTAPANAVNAYAILELWDATGTVWFDGAQLEKPIADSEGHIMTGFDYAENSSFEKDLNFWWTGGAAGATSVTSEAAWGGAKSVKVNLTAPDWGYVGSRYIPVRAVDLFTLSGFIKTNNLNGYGAYLELDYYDQNHNYISNYTTDRQTGTQDFTRYAKSITPPVNAAYVVLYGVASANSGTAYFDNIKLTPRATTNMFYDADGNYLTGLLDPMGGFTDFAYDAAGNRTMIKDQRGYITSFGYDALNNLTSVTDPMGKVFRFGYDPVSSQVAYRDGRSANETDNTYKTTFGYNELNQLTSVTDPLGRVIRNDYNDAGNLSATTFPNNRQVLYNYDAANRLIQKGYPGDPTQYNYSYDRADNLVLVTDEKLRNYSFGYDKANRMTSATDLFGYNLNFGMDSMGNVTSITDSNQKSVSYSYGSNGQMLTLTDTSGRQNLFRYDDAGRPFEIIKGNGLSSDIRYDRAGRVVEIADVGNPNRYAIGYSYDAAGNITRMSAVDGVHTYGYDTLNRLTSWTDGNGVPTTYSYDAVGNLTQKGSRTFTYNAANEITNPGFAYDDNGNMTTDGIRNYFYDRENRLVKVVNIADGSTVATYEYDYRGLRISKTTPSGTIRYHWDNKDRLVRESDTNGNTLALYIYDDKDQLQAIEKGGAIYYTHTNARGDILAITDAAGNRVATYKYGPWGELLSQAGTFDQPFRYAGYYYDSETGMYYLKARYYSPDLGRFLTKDTFKGFNEEPQTLNLYAYANGNPVINVDPDGHIPLALGAPLIFVPGIGWTLLAIGAGVATGVAIGTAINKRNPQAKYYSATKKLGGGINILGPLTDTAAKTRVLAGQDVYAPKQTDARKLAISASGGSVGPEVHSWSPLNKWHYHLKGRVGGHIFYG